VAYKFSDKFSVGAGISYVAGSVKLKQRVTTLNSLPPAPPAPPDGTVNLDGTGNGINWNVGILYRPTEDLSFGLSYRALQNRLQRRRKFTDMRALAGLFPGGTGKTTLPFPSNLFVGVAYNLSKDFTVEADSSMWDGRAMIN